MFKLDFMLLVLIFFGAGQIPMLMCARQYDVHTEAIRLYGADLRTVLNNFRRSSDYHKILTQRFEKLKERLRDIALQHMAAYTRLMCHHIYKKYGVSKPYYDRMASKGGRKGVSSRRFHSVSHNRRTDKKNSGVEYLDQHYQVHALEMRASERNQYRDMGFEWAGKILHAIITSMGPDDGPGKSTQLPGGGGEMPEASTKTLRRAGNNRANPVVSQPLVQGNFAVLNQSNYDPQLWTVVTIHGRDDSATSEVNTVLVPAFLAAEPCNVIVIDWSLGSTMTSDVMNAISSGQSIARFISWLISTAGGSLSRTHVIGASLGSYCAAHVGRALNGQLAYLTGLDPAHITWADELLLRPTDAVYTEAIYTNAGVMGYPSPLAHVNFYPNGGVNMPGCGWDALCDHRRPYFYFAETLTGGTFTGRSCASYVEAMAANCTGSETLVMGGFSPKTGATGIYYLETNAAPPFAQG